MITLDPTVSIGSIFQVLSTIALLIYIGRWAGRIETRVKSVEDDVAEGKTSYATRLEMNALHSAQSLQTAAIQRELDTINRRGLEA